MAIGMTTSATAPAEIYDRLHAAMLRHPMSQDVGLIAHAARATADGFEIIEVWESKEAFEHFMQEHAPAVLGEVVGDNQADLGWRTDEWEIRGLVIPGAGLAF